MTPATLLHMQQHARGENNNRSERYLEKLLLLGRHSCVWRNKFPPPYFPLRWGPFGGLVDVSAPPFIICMQAGDTNLALHLSVPPSPLAWRGVEGGGRIFSPFPAFCTQHWKLLFLLLCLQGGGGANRCDWSIFLTAVAKSFFLFLLRFGS